MEQNKVEILEALNNEKMYSLRGDEVGKMCSPEGNDTCGDCSTDVTGLGLKAQKTLEIKGFRWISSNEEGLPESLFALLTIVLTTGFQRGEAE